MHLGKKVYCERCDDQIGTGSALRAHIAAVHKGMRYICDICGQTYYSIRYKCDICGQTYCSSTQRHKI